MRTIFTIIALAINVLMFVSASSEIVTNNSKDKWESITCSMILVGTGFPPNELRLIQAFQGKHKYINGVFEVYHVRQG